MKKDKVTAGAMTEDKNVDYTDGPEQPKQVDIEVTDEGTGHDAINAALPKKTAKQNVSDHDTQAEADKIVEKATHGDHFEYSNIPFGKEVFAKLPAGFDFKEKEDIFVIRKK